MLRATLLAVGVAAATAARAIPCAISNVFSDHMVLQRDKPAMLFGFAQPGTSVTTTFAGNKYVTPADSNGVWRQSLLAQPATATPQTITFSCSTGEAFGLNDVLFGDVVLCGGQSNMQFTVPQLTDAFNVSAEIAAAAAYPYIRTVTVGQTTTSYFPLPQLAVPPIQPWAPASDPKVIAQGNWSATSAVCWFYGKTLADALGNAVPIGLVSSSWGGTIIQSWVSNATNTACGVTGASASLPAGAANTAMDFVTPGYEARVGAGPDPNAGHGVLYNAMIAPYTLGPMQISSMIWFQGESNNGQDALYECMQPGLINQWRNDFGTDGFFGFVELEPWVGGPAPDFRVAQLAALALPNVGYATATDCGDPTSPFGSVHPRNKKLIGGRLAAAALSLQYGVPRPWRAPSYARGVASGSGATAAVAVTFTDLPPGALLVAAADHCKTEQGVPADQCAGFVIVGSDGKSYPATAAPAADGRSVTLSAALAPGVTAAATSFGWAQWPINTVMTSQNLPLQPWAVTPVS